MIGIKEWSALNKMINARFIELLIFVKSSQLGIFVSNYQEIDEKIYLGWFFVQTGFRKF